MTPLRPSSPVRYAVVGFGHIAQVAVLPAFAHARRNSVLAALVSSDPEKRRALSERYDVPEAVDYAAYDRLLAGGSIDAVYVAVPNARHCEFALAALRAGVHVLCEKPLAVNERECELLIEASRQRGAKLMAAYRLHFDAASTHAMEIARSGELGELRLFDSVEHDRGEPHRVRRRQPRGGRTSRSISTRVRNRRNAFSWITSTGSAYSGGSCARILERRVGLYQFPERQIILRGVHVGNPMSHIGLAEKARWREVGRPRPHLDRIGPAFELHDEFVVRNFGLGAPIGVLLVVHRVSAAFMCLSACSG